MAYLTLLDQVYNSPRQILDTKLFKSPTKICLLDFIGATDYFITDFGGVWNRSKVYPNRRTGYVFKQYLPLVKLDPFFNFPWVLIPTQHGKLWFPIPQLVGYAFNCPKERDLKYCLPMGNISYSGLDYLEWKREVLTVVLPFKTSTYLQFIDNLYK